MPSLSTCYRTAFVTGASSGLGRAFAEMLMDEGVKVWGSARNFERLSELTNAEGFRPVLVDLGSPEKIDSSFTAASLQAGGAFDLVINNAGFGVFSPFVVAPFSVWRSQLEAMVTGSAQIAHLAMCAMVRRNAGCLVNVSSVAVEYPLPYLSGYNVAKAALSALTESLIFETRGTPVTVIDFRPGDFRTGFNHSMQATSAAIEPKPDVRLQRVWEVLEANLAAAPSPRKAALDLRRAVLRQKSGTVYSGSFFQVRLAPLFSRLAPARLRRAVAARYFGAV